MLEFSRFADFFILSNATNTGKLIRLLSYFSTLRFGGLEDDLILLKASNLRFLVILFVKDSNRNFFVVFLLK